MTWQGDCSRASHGNTYCAVVFNASNNEGMIVMKSRLACIGAGLCVLTIAACATDDPSTSTDDSAGEQVVDAETTTDPGWTAVDVPDLPPGTVMVNNDLGAIADGSTDSELPLPIRCRPDRVCLYQNIDFNDFKAGCVVAIPPTLKRNLKDLPCVGTGGNFNNRMSSWANVSFHRACWWTDAGQKGHKHVMNPRTAQPNVGSAANDRASSVGPC
jgi:hypothetical protein